MIFSSFICSITFQHINRLMVLLSFSLSVCFYPLHTEVGSPSYLCSNSPSNPQSIGLKFMAVKDESEI